MGEGCFNPLKGFYVTIPVPKRVLVKVENISDDSLDSIPSPSPSVKIQIIGGKVYLR